MQHHAGVAASPAGVRMADGPKVLVPDGYEGYSHSRMEEVELPTDISGEESSLKELQVEIGALPVTSAAPSIPVRLEGTGCLSGQRGHSCSCFLVS